MVSEISNGEPNVLDSAILSWAAKYLSGGHWICAKRLSGNDTVANGSHQAGPYLPKEVVLGAFPEYFREDLHNPKHRVILEIDSHRWTSNPDFTWYNNKFRGGTRNETRVTGFGGRQSPLLEAENTGALAVFVFISDRLVRCWVCKDVNQENALEEFLSPIEPGETIIIRPDGTSTDHTSKYNEPLPEEWHSSFPSTQQILEESVRRDGHNSNRSADGRLIARRKIEFALFKRVEDLHELPRISAGYPSVESFVQHANSVLQRRKARSGRSLELHVQRILEESGFIRNLNFAIQARTEGKRTPDFLFPREDAYHDVTFPESRLFMLAAKTTCKDRWRQVLNEAKRIHRKHLLTLQEGISKDQFEEMRDSGIELIVPRGLHGKYAKEIQPLLWTLDKFIEYIKLNQQAY